MKLKRSSKDRWERGQVQEGERGRESLFGNHEGEKQVVKKKNWPVGSRVKLKVGT